jgi:hypothetical protein
MPAFLSLTPRVRQTGLFRRAAAVGVLTTGLVRGANPAPFETPAVLPPLPSLVAFASGHHCALGRFASSVSGQGARDGDAVTFLVSLSDERSERQWLVDLEVADLNESERTTKPPPDYSVTPSAGGPEIRFSNAHRLALEIRTTGPFTADLSDPTPPTARARTLLSPDLLGLGLDQSCRLIAEITARNGPNPNLKPALSPEENRTMAGMLPALAAFFDTTQRTPGVREILWDILVKPSLWSIVRRKGRVDTGLDISDIPARLDPAPWRTITATEVYRMPLTVKLNDRPALVSALIVTAPRPPLLTCAGIIGIEAEPPDRPGKHLSIRIVASRRTEAVPPP